MRMLQEHFDIKLTFQRSEIQSMEDEEKDDFLQWLNTLTDGSPRGENFFTFGSLFPPKTFKYENLTEKQNFSSVYCVENSTNLGDCLLIANVGEELSKLSSLFVSSNQFSVNIFHKLRKWEDIKEFSSPCTDIIIVDKFILSNPEIYSPNLLSLIKSLCGCAIQTRLNIVIFTLKEVYNKETKIKFTPEWDKIYQSIRKCVGKRTPSPNVTFVTASDRNLDEHDRTIFTNYKSFASGDTFNYFNSSGKKITQGRTFYPNSLVTQNNYDDAEKFLNDMQVIINNLLRLNPNLILKDKVSNFLTFS